MNGLWLTYLLRCADGKIYTGVTNDLKKRISAHNRGEASRFTRARLPVTLLASSRAMTKVDAFRLEYAIKRLPREKKVQALKSGLTGKNALTKPEQD
jgi:putative endonuclease